MGIQSWWKKIKGTSNTPQPSPDPEGHAGPESPEEPDLSKVFAGVYMVELLFEEAPAQLDGAAIHRELLSLLGKVHWAGKDAGPAKEAHFQLYMLEDHTFALQETQMPMQVMVMKSDKAMDRSLPSDPQYAMSFHQSWLYPDAAGALSSCKATALVSDMMSSNMEPQARMHAYQRALWAMVKVLQPKAIHFQHSQQFLDAQHFLANVPDTPDYDPLLGILNVRMFRVNDGDSGDMIMDTLGLAALGIPDLQMHFRDLDPQQVAGVLNGTGHYLFENGDVIEDGHTITGWDEAQRWRCQHEVSVVDPQRIVVDINPGAPFVAGGRN